MMQVKKYRAATTREALEQIKRDMGENAFVLETKQVQTKGFLGFGAATQIEVSAATANVIAKPTLEKRENTSRFTTLSLNLTDDAPAVPNNSETTNTISTKENLLAVLKARTENVRSVENQTVFSQRQFIEEPKTFDAPKAIEAVELSPEAPKIVHQKRETPKPLNSEQTIHTSGKAETSANTNQSKELELLRAELREMKFSIASFSNRQNVQVWQNGVDLDLIDEIFESPFYEAYLELTATGVSSEIAHKVISDIIEPYKSGAVKTKYLAATALLRSLPSLVKFAENPLQQNKPATMAIIGSTGVGKTTTIAKLAARVALHERRRVELVTLDTYRIAAVEQLKTYAEIIGAGCTVVRSVFELDAVLRRFPEDATVLIDTTGKNPHDLADQYELADYLRERKEIHKCLALQATTHHLDGIAAVKKFAMYGADCMTFTKMDETTRPGAMVELAAEGLLPLVYLCMGQRVPEDMQTATPESLVTSIFRGSLKK